MLVEGNYKVTCYHSHNVPFIFSNLHQENRQDDQASAEGTFEPPPTPTEKKIDKTVIEQDGGDAAGDSDTDPDMPGLQDGSSD